MNLQGRAAPREPGRVVFSVCVEIGSEPVTSCVVGGTASRGSLPKRSSDQGQRLVKKFDIRILALREREIYTERLHGR